MNLHEWIAGRVGAVEKTAQKATKCGSAEWQACGSLVLTIDREGAERVAGADIMEAVSYRYDDALVHAAEHDPATALRRCEADRRVLARHCQDMTWYYSPACDGCGRTGDMDDATTENINECPELLDLAHAHGITEEELAALDVPQTPSRPPGRPVAVQARMTAEQAPASLRGRP